MVNKGAAGTMDAGKREPEGAMGALKRKGSAQRSKSAGMLDAKRRGKGTLDAEGLVI